MKPLVKTSLYNALGTLAYILLVSLLMRHGDILFGKTDTYLSPVIFLLLFVISASVVGGLVVGKPLLLYIEGKKREGVSLFLQTIGWLAGCMAVLLIVIAFTSK